jgi:hypothetical protein
MAEETVSPWPAIAGFSVVSGTMVVCLGVLLFRAPPPLPWAETEGEAEAEVALEDHDAQKRIYLPLNNSLTVALEQAGPQVVAKLALAVRGSAENLLTLDSLVEARLGTIEAGVVRAAQEVVASGADTQLLHAELPERLRMVINGEIGTDSWPDPVEEVLITSLTVN